MSQTRESIDMSYREKDSQLSSKKGQAGLSVPRVQPAISGLSCLSPFHPPMYFRHDYGLVSVLCHTFEGIYPDDSTSMLSIIKGGLSPLSLPMYFTSRDESPSLRVFVTALRSRLRLVCTVGFRPNGTDLVGLTIMSDGCPLSSDVVLVDG